MLGDYAVTISAGSVTMPIPMPIPISDSVDVDTIEGGIERL